MTGVSAIRFFTIAPLHSPFLLLALTAAGLSGVAVIVADSGRVAEALGPLALVQLFAASSGFAVPARRGHLDLLLTAGVPRLSVACAHLTLSIAPGLAVWVIVGVAEMVAGQTTAPRAFASGTAFALVATSVIAWALTVPLPRLSGGIAWLLATTIWFVGWFDGIAWAAQVRDGRADALTSAIVITLFPYVLLGQPLSAARLLAALPAFCAAAAAGAIALAWIVHTDVPLESAQ